MGQAIGHRPDDHPLDQPGTPPANDQKVGLLTLADRNDHRGRITQLLDRREIDVMEVDGVFHRRQDLLLSRDQCFRQGRRGGRLAGDAPPALGRSDHGQQDQTGMVNPRHGGGERGGAVALLGPVHGRDNHMRNPVHDRRLNGSDASWLVPVRWRLEVGGSRPQTSSLKPHSLGSSPAPRLVPGPRARRNSLTQ